MRGLLGPSAYFKRMRKWNKMSARILTDNRMHLEKIASAVVRSLAFSSLNMLVSVHTPL